MREAFKSSQFWQSWVLMFFGVIYAQYVFLQFKVFGGSQINLHTDMYLTIVGGIGFLFVILARLTGGEILEQLPFKYYFALIALTSAVLSYTFPLVGKSDAMFSIYICISNFLFGCIQAGWPCYYAQTFGPELGSLLYPFFFTASCFANFIIALIVYELQKQFLGH